MKNEHYVVEYEMNQSRCARFVFTSLSEAFTFTLNTKHHTLILHVSEVSPTESVEDLIAEVHPYD